MAEEVLRIKLQAELATFNQQMAKAQKTMLKTGKTGGETFRNYQKSVLNAEGAQKRFNTSIRASRIEFKGWALSVLFFGQALKQAFTQVVKFGTKAFNDIMNSVEGTVTQFNLMEGSMKFLGFAIGAAMEPIIGMLIPIVDGVANWILENEKLFAIMLTALGVGGTVLVALGFTTLAIDGIAGAMLAFGIATDSAIVSMNLLTGGTIIGGLILAAFWVTKIFNSIDSAHDKLIAFPRGVLLMGAAISGIFAGVIAEVVALVPRMINLVVSGVELLINRIIKKVNTLISVLNRIPGTDIAALGDVDFSRAKFDVGSFGDPFKDTFSSVFGGGVRGVESVLPLEGQGRQAAGFVPGPSTSQSQPTTIILQVDGEQISNVISRNIMSVI